MSRVLESTGNTAAAAQIDALLEETNVILEKCRTYAVAVHTQTIHKDVPKEAYNTQLLYTALNLFEAHKDQLEIGVNEAHKAQLKAGITGLSFSLSLSFSLFLSLSPSLSPSTFCCA
jgi:hypothetical protein